MDSESSSASRLWTPWKLVLGRGTVVSIDLLLPSPVAADIFPFARTHLSRKCLLLRDGNG
jgi:hypothetical protein